MDQPHKHCLNCGYKLDGSSNEAKNPAKKSNQLKWVFVFFLVMFGLAILAQVSAGAGAL